MNKVILTLLIIYAVTFSSSSNAQAVVLINGEPTKVLLDNATIVDALNEDVSYYLDGFDTEIPENKIFSILEKQNEFVFQQSKSIQEKKTFIMTEFNKEEY